MLSCIAAPYKPSATKRNPEKLRVCVTTLMSNTAGKGGLLQVSEKRSGFELIIMECPPGRVSATFCRSKRLTKFKRF